MSSFTNCAPFDTMDEQNTIQKKKLKNKTIKHKREPVRNAKIDSMMKTIHENMENIDDGLEDFKPPPPPASQAPSHLKP